MIINTQTKQYPITEQQVKDANPNTSFPSTLIGLDLTSFGFAWVQPTEKPTYNTLAEYPVEDTPVDQDGIYKQVWKLVPLAPNDCLRNAQMLIQNHLDTTVRQYNYDGILSATTYAPSTNAKFAAEGNACVQWRDAVWGTSYQILNEVLVGLRPMPTPESLVAALPVLVWPS